MDISTDDIKWDTTFISINNVQLSHLLRKENISNESSFFSFSILKQNYNQIFVVNFEQASIY